MNSDHQAPTRSPEETAALKDFFTTIQRADKEGRAVENAAREALPRLVRVAYSGDSSQAVRVAAALASIYNGSDAAPVRLDELRSMDWQIQKDLAAVIFGIGKSDLDDTAIRDAFRELGGNEAVDFLHWHTTNGPQLKALHRLIAFVKANEECSTAVYIKKFFLSIIHGTPAELSRLNRMDDDISTAFVVVLDALFGANQGKLYIEDIQRAWADAGVELDATVS